MSIIISENLISTIKNHPATLIMAVIAGMISLGASFYQTYQEFEQTRIQEENLTLTKQIEALDEFEANLASLMVFVDQQKRELRNKEELITRLENEQSRLQPIVEADREVVEAMFRTQAEMQRADVWLDRLIGFFLGIAGSLLATLIWAALRGSRTQART